MAIVFSYPPIGFKDVQASDRLLISQMTVEGNPTRSVTVNNLRQYLGAIIPTNIVTGSGTTNRLTKWKAPVGSGVIEDSSIEDTGSEINVQYKLNINNATSNANGIVFPHPAGGASGVVNMYYNGAAAGSRFVISRAATGGAEIELQSNGDVNINRLGNGNFLVGGEVTLDDYGAGTITGVPTFYLAVDVNGKIIEESSAGGIGGTGTINTLPVFTAANTIGDSMVSQNAGATVASISGELVVNNGLTVTNLGVNPVDFGGSTYLFEPGQAEFSAELDMQGNLIKDLPGPVAGTDAVNKNYVDTETTAVKTALGYNSVQVFQWTAGNPVIYTNFPIGGGTSALPFDATPLVETGTYTGTAADFAWTCANQPGGTATQFAEFTLGPNGSGTWEISTAQHWFDQNQFLEVNATITINGTIFEVINERVNDGAGDRLFYGSIVREFSAADVVVCSLTFANGTGSNPFPAATNNRPIEITFNKLV